MTKAAFFEKYLDPRWQEKKGVILRRDKFTCLSCEDKNKTLHVHHVFYVKGRMPWDYPDWSLSTLCKDCHKEAEDQKVEDRGDESRITEIECIFDHFMGGSCKSDELGLWEVVCLIHTARIHLPSKTVLAAIMDGVLRVLPEEHQRRAVIPNGFKPEWMKEAVK